MDSSPHSGCELSTCTLTAGRLERWNWWTALISARSASSVQARPDGSLLAAKSPGAARASSGEAPRSAPRSRLLPVSRLRGLRVAQVLEVLRDHEAIRPRDLVPELAEGSRDFAVVDAAPDFGLFGARVPQLVIAGVLLVEPGLRRSFV